MAIERDSFKPNDEEALRVFSGREKTEFQPLIENVYLGVFVQENIVGKVGTELLPEAVRISEGFEDWKNRTAESFYNRNSELGTLAGDTIRDLTLEKAHQYSLNQLSKYRRSLMAVRTNPLTNALEVNSSEESELRLKTINWHHYSRVINYAKIKSEKIPKRTLNLPLNIVLKDS